MNRTRCSAEYAYQKMKSIGISENIAVKNADKLYLYTMEAGELIWKRGTNLPGYNYVIDGLISASITDNKSESFSVAVYGTNSWFGEQAVIANLPIYADYVAIYPTELITLPRDVLISIIYDEPNFATKITKMVACRAQSASEMMLIMQLANAATRSVMGIYYLAEGFAEAAREDNTQTASEKITLPIAQSVIATICGVSRTVLSKCLQKLSSIGMVTVEYGQVTINRYSVWGRFAQKNREKLIFNKASCIDDLLSDLLQASINDWDEGDAAKFKSGKNENTFNCYKLINKAAVERRQTDGSSNLMRA